MRVAASALSGRLPLRRFSSATLRLDVLAAGAAADQPLTELDGDVGGVERVLGGEQRLLVLVLLAEHARPLGQIVKLLLDLRLDQRPLLLDHQDQVEALGELAHALRLERPGHADLVDPDAELIGPDLVDAKLVHGLANVEIALAGGDDAELGPRAAAYDDAVDPVGAVEREDGRQLVVVQARFLDERLVAEADAEAAGRRGVVVRDLDLHAVDAAVDGGGGLDVVLHALEADPHAGIARQGETQDPVVQDLLNARRVQDRDHEVEEGELGLVRGGGAFGGMVVAHQREHAAVLGGAGVVGVAEDVARAVDAGALAVPDAEYAVVLALAPQLGLLRAPQRGGGQVLVEAGHELDVVGLQDALGAEHGGFERGDGRAAIAGHVTGRIEPRAHVAGALGQHEADDGLGAGQQLAGLVEGVFVVEAHRVLGHGVSGSRVNRLVSCLRIAFAFAGLVVKAIRRQKDTRNP